MLLVMAQRRWFCHCYWYWCWSWWANAFTYALISYMFVDLICCMDINSTKQRYCVSYLNNGQILPHFSLFHLHMIKCTYVISTQAISMLKNRKKNCSSRFKMLQNFSSDFCMNWICCVYTCAYTCYIRLMKLSSNLSLIIGIQWNGWKIIKNCSS